MKKNLLLVLFLSLSCVAVKAETDSTPTNKKAKAQAAAPTDDASDYVPPKVSLLVFSGMNLGVVGTTSTSGLTQVTDHRTGYAGGVGVELMLTEHLALRPEFMYVQEGGSYSSSTGVINVNYDALQLPVLAEWKWGNEFIQGSVFAGPAFAFAVNTVQIASATGVSSNYLNLRAFDIALQGGAGIDLTASRGLKVFMNLRYSLGLLDQDNDTTTSTRLSNWLFLGGLSIGL